MANPYLKQARLREVKRLFECGLRPSAISRELNLSYRTILNDFKELGIKNIESSCSDAICSIIQFLTRLGFVEREVGVYLNRAPSTIHYLKRRPIINPTVPRVIVDLYKPVWGFNGGTIEEGRYEVFPCDENTLFLRSWATKKIYRAEIDDVVLRIKLAENRIK